MKATIALLVSSVASEDTANLLQTRLASNQQAAACGQNEFLNNCGKHCEGSCEIVNPICTFICGPEPACQCNSGFVRQDGECIPLSECPAQTCGANEYLNNCGNHCEGSCGNQNPICPMICGPEPACQCKNGFVRQDDGFCIPTSQCLPTCGANEFLNDCGNHCEGTCGNQNPICPYICGPAPACQCKNGFVRQDGECVPANQCPTTLTCGENEVLNDCGDRCDRSCGNLNPICPSICDPPACVCSPGFARQDGVCVPTSQC